MILYKVSLNWYNESQVFHTYAISKNQAINNAFIQLAKKLKINVASVKRYFNGKADKVKVEEVKTKSDQVKESLQDFLNV
jgi:hypothetical protein